MSYSNADYGESKSSVMPSSRRGTGSDDIVFKRKKQMELELHNILNSLRGDTNYVLITNRINLFFDDTQASLTAMREALEELDLATLEALVDELRRATGSMGAIQMMKICYHIQLQAGRGALHEIGSALNDLQAEFDLVRQGLVCSAS